MNKKTFIKKLISVFMILCFSFSNTMLAVLATDITGVNPSGTVPGGAGNVYNIEGQQFSGQTQFRQYEQFKLDNGDVANLIYKNGYNAFVNLVDNQVNINGIVNTMQNNNFFNGHAIFVSPQGMVVGASGVLNVGSLSILTPSVSQYNTFLSNYNSGNLAGYELGKTQYNNLIQDSQGNILVNGKIIARKDVNLYGSNITIKKDTSVQSNNTAGIIAGYKGTSPIYNVTDAEAVFNSLVSNNQINANGMELDSNGNITLVANKVVQLTNDDVDSEKLSETVSTAIDIDNATLASGNAINASANSDYEITTTVDKVTSALKLPRIISGQQSILSLIGAELNEYFEGTRANSTIDVINSQIYSNNGTSLASNAVAKFIVSTPDDANASKLIYALGTETLSRVNVEQNSTIEAGGDFIAKAFSENTSNLTLKNIYLYNTSSQETDKANNLMLVNQTSKSTTTSTADASNIKAKNISLISRNYNSDKLNIDTDINPDNQTGFAINAIVKNQQIDTTSEVKNNSTITSASGTVDIASQNLSVIQNDIDLLISSSAETKEYTVEQGDVSNINKTTDELQQQLTRATAETTSNENHGRDAANKITGNQPSPNTTTPSLTSSGSSGSSSTEIGGSLIVNRSNINTTSQTDNSSITGAVNTYVTANAVDLTSNVTETLTEGATSFATGLAVTVDLTEKNTLAQVLNGSTINSSGLFVNATTELPLNADALKLVIKNSGIDTSVSLSTDVSSDEWDLSGTDTWTGTKTQEADYTNDYTATGSNSTEVKLQTTSDTSVSYEKFFHNIAKSTSTGSGSTTLSGSFVYNTLLQNTKAILKDSTIETTNDIGLNAVSSITNYSAAGAIDFILSYLQEDGTEIMPASSSGKYTIGGAVLINFLENNANALIDNSNVTSASGNINLTSANEQSFISGSAMGAKGTTLALEGSVVVETLEGSTNAKIINSSNINANGVNVIAGQGMLNPVVRENYVPVLNDDTGLIKLNSTPRTSNDKLMNVVISGAVMSDGSGSDNSTAIGASVNVINLNRSLNSIIEDSVISALNGVDVESLTYLQGVNVAIAGTFKGGVSTDKDYQFNANAGSGDTNGAQAFANYGGWINDLDSVVGDDSTFDTDTENYEPTTANATESTILNALKGTSTQEAMTSTTSKVVTEEDYVYDENGNKVADPLKSGDDAYLKQQKTVLYQPEYDEDYGKYVYKNSGGEILFDNNDPPNPVEVQVSEGTETLTTDLSTELANLSASSNSNNNNGGLLTSGNSNSGTTLTGNTATSESGKSNFAVTVAGSVNVYNNTSTMNSKVSDSTITTGGEFNLIADQSNELLNNANCETKAGKVGVGGAVNVSNFHESTQAILEQSTINKSNTYEVNIKASDYNKVTDQATGSGSSESSGSAAVAIGGSINVAIDESFVKASSLNSTLNNAGNISVISNNYIDIYSNAGITGKEKTSGTGVGIGIAGNINILKDTSIAEINGSSNIDSGNLYVIANDKGTQTNNIKSVAMSAGILTGGSSASFMLEGSFGTDIIEDTITAQIIDATDINATGDVKVDANSNLKVVNLDGTLAFSTASAGAGVGLGAIVEVYDNNINTKIQNSNILSSNSVDISSVYDKDLKLIAANLGIITTANATVNVNGIVNVIKDKINSYITDSTITTTGNLNFAATHNIDETAITIIGNGAKQVAIGGTAVVNILEADSKVEANKDSSISAGGDITVSDYIEECIKVDTAGVTASQSATAIAATVDVNLITNSTQALFSADVLQSKSLTVNATDLTTETAERNLLVSATGGAFALGGVVTIDIVDKNTQAKISDAENISSSGIISVNAKSDNAFGAKKDPDKGIYPETEIGSIAAIIDAENTTNYMSNSKTVAYWQYAINGSGATVGINETVVVKDIDNNISATIENTDIKQAGGVEVTVNDYTINNALLGDVVGSKTVSIGGAEYINVLTSNVAAKILSGTKINSDGNITVSANNREVLRDILIAAGGAGTVTINGDASVNVIENTTEAIIDQNVNISKANNISVIAQNSDDAEAADVSAAGSGSAQIGGIFKFNQFESKTNAKIGVANATQTKIDNVSGDITIAANQDEYFSAMMYTAGGSGLAAIDGIAVVNIFGSETNSIVDNSAITTTGGKIDVTASHDYNYQEDGSTVSANMLYWMQSNEDDEYGKATSEYISDFQNQVSAGKFTPLVSSLNIEGSGGATITGNITSNNFDSTVTAKVDNNSIISSKNGLNVSADQTLTTFDAMAGVVGAAYASIVINGVVNVINDVTNAFVNNSTVTAGGAFAKATESMNINSAQFGIGGAMGAAILTAVDVSVIDNATKAYVTDSNITGGAKADAEAVSFINNFFVIAGGSEFASIMLEPAVNYYIGNVAGYIDETTINGGENLASGITNFTTNNLLAAGSLAISGAAINALAIVNDLIFNTSGYITDTEITDAISTQVKAEAANNTYSFGASLAIAAIGGAIPAIGIVSDYHNNQNAYIKDSSIQGGSVLVTAANQIITNTCNSAIGAGIVGGTICASGLVNYLISETNAYIYNVEATDVTDTTVTASSIENLKNNNIGIGGGAGTICASAIVNVLENATRAYIDVQDKNYSSTGAMNVKATDEYELYCLSGIVNIGIGNIGANVNVNEVNNTVNAYINGTTGKLKAGSIDVSSSSIIGMMNEANSIAAGVGNITGNVVVSMIGGDVNFSSIQTSQTDLYKTLTEAVNDEKATVTALGYDVRMSSSTERGSIATLGGTVETKNNINVKATNTLKGYDENNETYHDKYQSSNATISAALGEVSAGVHYAEMKYNTKAAIEFSDVTSENGDISLSTDNYLKGQTDILTITAGIGTLDGAVAYFLSNALTQSYINSSKVTAGGTLNIDAKTYSKFVSNAQKASVSGVDYLLSIADTDDQSKVYSKIVGDNNNITAKNINITSTAGADLSTDLEADVITALKVTTVFNSANSNIDSQALVEAINADINVDNMTIATKNSGIKLVNTYHSGSFSVVSADADEQGSFGGATFKSGIINPSGDTNCVNISGYTDNFAENINIYNNSSTSDNAVAGTIYTEVIEDQNKISGISGAGLVHDAKSDLSAITSIQNGSGTIKTNNMNIFSLADRTAKIMSSTGQIGLGISVNVYTINTNTTGDNTITFSGESVIADTLNIALNDNNNVYTQITNNNITLLVNVNPITVGSNANVNTDVTLSDYLTAENINIDTDINRYAYASADLCGGSLIQVNVINLTAETSGNSTLNISQKTPDGYNYANNMNVNNNSLNTSETYYTSSTGGFVDVENAHCNNNLNATTSLNIENADIKSTGDINIGVKNDNIIIRKQESAEYGVVVVASSDNINSVNNSTNLTVKDSKVKANNITLSATSHFGDPTAPMLEYSGYGGGFVAQDWTSITTNITQATGLSLTNAIMEATNVFTANVNSDSVFKSKMKADTDGFVAGGAPKSKINANNTNTFTADASSTITADYAYINMNSSNDLSSEAYNYVDGFSGTCGANPDAQANLTVKNTVNSNGKIEAANLAQIDFMTGSTNKLYQHTFAEIDAAMPFGGVDGSVSSNITNQLNVPANALISSGKDVIGNFMEGDLTIDSLSEDNITCRMLFGIPIDCSDDPKYTSYRTLTNGMSFDGEIVAQAGNQKYLKIDRNGDVVQSTGFANDGYTVYSGIGNISGAELKDNMLKSLQTLDEKLKASKDSIETEIAKNDAKKSEYEKLKDYDQAQYDYLNTTGNIAGKVADDQKTTVANVETEMDTNIRSQAVQADGLENPDPNKITETQYSDMIDYFAEIMKGDDTKDPPVKPHNPTSEEITAYMNEQGFTEAQQKTLTNAVNAEKAKVVEVEEFKQYYKKDSEVYHEYDGKTIISDDAKTSRINYLSSSVTNLTTEIDALEDTNDYLSELLTDINNKISRVEGQIDYINGKVFPDTIFSDTAYVFEDIASSSGQIQLNNLINYNITGSGNFIIPDSAVQIENYSGASLIFKSIYNTQATDGGNLIINGRNFNDADHTNSTNEVNCKNDQHDGVGPHLTTSYQQQGLPPIEEGITIRNYFDNNDPVFGNNKAPSNIMITGVVESYADLYIWNESGSISFANSVDSVGKTIYATQGNIAIANPDVDLVLDAGDILYAGKNITFNVNSLENNGSITVGRNERKLTITNDMLSNLIEDPSTGDTNMINIGLDDNNNSPSPYLNTTKDNIKALYKDNKIQVFSTFGEGGKFSLFRRVGTQITPLTPTGNGSILATTGYSNINIVNNTSSDMVIFNIRNNYMEQSDSNPQLTQRPVIDAATTNILSNLANLEANGYIQNAYKADEYGTGILNIDGKKILINNYLNYDETQGEAIEAYGYVNITAQDGIDIAGYVYERGGNVTIENDAANSSLTMLMMAVQNVTDGLNLESTGIIDTEGTLNITNLTGAEGITIAGAIVNNVGNTTITNGNNDNKSIKSLKITGSVDNKNGSLDITNYGAETVSVTRPETGTQNIEQGIQILGTISNNGATNITTNNGIIRVPVEGTSTSDMQQGKITTTGGTLNINNPTGLGINVEGEITNQNNTINITNGTDSTKELASGTGIRIFNRVFDDQTVANALVQTSVDSDDAITITNYGKLGIGINGTISNTGTGDIIIDNLCTAADAYGIRMTSNAVIENSEGNLYITNHAQEGGVTLLGKIDVPMGDVIIKDDSEIKHGITINTIDKREGDIILYNEGTDPATPTVKKGITILGQLCTDDGNIYIYNQDSDITFGFNTESSAYPHKADDDGYIVANHGNVVITLKNGSILNTLTDFVVGEHSNYDKAQGIEGNCYRTMIVAKGKEDGLGNLTISVTDGDIGQISTIKGDKAGDINSGNLDYRDSINVNVEGAINLYVRNSETNQDATRVVNLRAKESDLNIRHAFVQGDMILSAPDWKQNDDITLAETDPDYYNGYSVKMTGDGILNGVTARNLTVIASNDIGSEENPFTYVQFPNDTNSQTAAFEAENDIYLLAKGKLDNEININQIVTKQGNLDLNFIHEANIQYIASAAGNVTLHLGDTTFIDTIGSNDHLDITQDKGDLFIKNIGGNNDTFTFNDILYHHDNILLADDGGIPQTIDIEVNGDDSTLLVYNTLVKGANNGAGAYDVNGNRLTDVKLSANKIITSATDIPTSCISTNKNPNGFVFTLPEETIGIRAYGEGSELALELTGSSDSIADTIIASVNSDNSRGVILNKLYSNDAYINTVDKKLNIVDGYINNYAEIRTGDTNNYYDKFAVVDNDFRRLLYSRKDSISVQLYTGLTGNFSLGLNDTIKMTTTAPVVHYNPYLLVNRYSDQNSFYNLSMKEDSVQRNFIKHKKDMEITIPRLDYTRVLTFDVMPDTDLISNVKIYKISRTGASIQTDDTMKVKKVIPIKIKLDNENVDVTVNAKVVRIENGVAEVKFVDMPQDVANKLMYRNFKANSKGNDLTMNTKNNTL